MNSVMANSFIALLLQRLCNSSFLNYLQQTQIMLFLFRSLSFQLLQLPQSLLSLFFVLQLNLFQSLIYQLVFFLLLILLILHLLLYLFYTLIISIDLFLLDIDHLMHSFNRRSLQVTCFLFNKLPKVNQIHHLLQLAPHDQVYSIILQPFAVLCIVVKIDLGKFTPPLIVSQQSDLQS